MEHKPISFFEFTKRFKDDEKCREHLFRIRWPEGFTCPCCQNDSYYYIRKRKTYQCTNCRHQTSVTAGTIMDKTHIPLEKWYWAAYLVSTDKRGKSATALSRELDIGYKSAWYLLHRIRKAMSDREEETALAGIVELDDSYFGAAESGGKRGRGSDKVKVVVGMSLNDYGRPRHIKMEPVRDVTSETLSGFAERHICSGSAISTDAFNAYNELGRIGYDHRPKVFDTKSDSDHLKWLHTIVSNAKSFINGTYHGLDEKHLNLYLSEFCFRFKRRSESNKLFNRLLFSCTVVQKIPFAVLTE